MIEWLFANEHYPKFLYATPQFVFGGYGVDKHLEQPSQTIYPLIGFNQFFEGSKKGDLWIDFPQKTWIKPKNFRLENRFYPTLEPLLSHSLREDFPNKECYASIFGKASKEAEKIVLARKTLLKFDENLCIKSLLNNHLGVFKTQDIFFYSPKPQVAFMGASPERLYEKKNQTLYTAAIAGTLSIDKDSDLLLHSIKDLKEHQFVVADLKEKLGKVCDSIHYAPSPNIVTSHHLFHLKTPFEGLLKPGITDHELIKTLHPTSAVLGTPFHKAHQAIQFHEPFDRGMYAAPFGLILDETSFMTVAIRSILVKNEHIYAFAGSGVVEGSDVELEWNELNHKISPYLW